MRFAVLAFTLLVASPVFCSAAEVTVTLTSIDNRKAVVATVEPVRQLVARTRIGGTVVSLSAKEGSQAASGQELAVVADPKFAIQIEALDQRINSLSAQRDKAANDYHRTQELQKRGVSTTVQLDAAKTAFDVAERTLAAMQSDRDVIVQQIADGKVQAPGSGRILTVPASVGRVVLPGETIATLAEDRYILRLQLPERHAQSMRAGDKVLIGARGLAAETGEILREGQVRLVYPEIQGGRVVADVDVEGLGDYFVGERTRAYVTTGKRDVILVSKRAIHRRGGVDYITLKGGIEVVVQPGEEHQNGVEILAGLRTGDIVVTP
ncbi:MAG: efflux RND transporter periplasmic adaptor subunit [Hyphomicrobiaceae bacterium]